MSSTVIHSVNLVTGGEILADAWVRFDDGVVSDVGTGSHWPQADEVVDASVVAGSGAILTPGFVDIHGHGGGGFSYENGVESIRAARAMHRSRGTTRAVLSLVTGSMDALEAQTRMIAELTAEDSDILGSHLEGPFLDPGHKGAHDPGLLRDPTPERVERLLNAGGGTVRQVTLAPELPSGVDAVRRIVAAGASAAVGHTNATREQAAAAFDAGATILTHAFNAMPPVHHRLPGPIGAACADDRVMVEVIADGVHVHPSVLGILAAAVGNRLCLITDAMAAAGSDDGQYRLGDLDVTVTDGVARLTGTETIAGSTLTQDKALQVSVAAGIPLVDAVHALTEAPARAVGCPAFGRLVAGGVADAVLLDAQLHVQSVWADGRLVD